MVEQSRHVFMSCMYVRDVRTMVLLECTVLEYVLEYVLREYAYTRVPACVTAAIPVCCVDDNVSTKNALAVLTTRYCCGACGDNGDQDMFGAV